MGGLLATAAQSNADGTRRNDDARLVAEGREALTSFEAQPQQFGMAARWMEAESEKPVTGA